MKKIFSVSVILFLFSTFYASAAEKQPSKEQVTNVCTTHYSNVVTDIIGALNMGMSVEEVKKNLSGKKSINKQLSLLYTLIDLLPTDKEQAKYDAFNALVDQCVADNFNKPRTI